MKKNKILFAFTIVAILTVSLFCFFGSNAVTTATITATVDTNPTAIGQTFIASINVAGVQDFWAWNANVSWNPAVLNATKVAKGPLLTSSGESDAFMPGTIDNVNGLIKGGPTQTLLSTGSVSGDGVIAKITFVVVGSGTSNIALGNIRLLAIVATNPAAPTQQDITFTQGPTLTINIPSSNPTPTPTTGGPTPTPTSGATPTPTPTSSQGQASIRVFTDQNDYNPGDLVQVYANVTYNGAAVSSKDVAFTIHMQNSTDLGTIVNRTNTNGIS